MNQAVINAILFFTLLVTIYPSLLNHFEVKHATKKSYLY